MRGTRRKFFLAVIILLSLPLLVFAQSSKNVLLLHSYHQGFKWTDEQNDSIVNELSTGSSPIKYYIEYMGTKWVYDKDYLDLLPELYRLKFKAISFDLVVATDDDAFTFLLQYREGIFGDIPVVFCGVNWFDKKRIEGLTGYTGVNEDADIALNVDLMLRLHPQVKNIYLIVDGTTTGRLVRRKIEDIIPVYRERVSLHILDNFDVSQLVDKVSQLSDDSLVFLTLFQKDSSGRFVEPSEIARQLSTHSPVPVYALWDFYLGYGVVGGMMTSGTAQGRSAGKLGLRILQGASADTLPVILASPNCYRFDYLQLKRFGIKTSLLPTDSRLINEPSSFYTFSKKFVWLLTIGSFLIALAIVILAVNIHRRSRAERALWESDKKYHALVDNLRVGVYRNIADTDGTMLQANPAMVNIYGYASLEEFKGVYSQDLYQDPKKRQQFLAELGRNGFVKDRELPMKKKDGTPIWVLSNATAVFDEKGTIKWVDGVNEDITERKNLEEQLRQAQKMEAIGTLAGGVAHDFNNILTAIIGFGSLLKVKVGDDENFLEYLNPILVSAEKAAHLTKSLLAFSRRQVINLKAVDINEIVEGMNKLLRRIVREDIQLHIVRHADCLMALADRGQMEQVLMNLVANARDAMPTGGQLYIETDCLQLDTELLVRHEVMHPGSYVVLTVSDTGSGIDEATKDKIFEPFFSTKSIGKGTGLGLSIVYGIVKQHNGSISVYSEPGKGAIFTVYLPLVDEDRNQPEAIPRQVPVEGGSETILLGEDNDGVRHLAEEILTLAGYTVISAVDGEDVLEKFNRNSDKIDLLLLDVVMPKKNGKEVFDAVNVLRPDMKVLFMSGYTANIIHEQGILNEGVNFIAKPLSPDGILLKVREVLSQQKAKLRRQE